MADVRINALTTTATSSATDDYLAIDGTTNGTRKMSAYNPAVSTITTAGNAIIGGVAHVGDTATPRSSDPGYNLNRTLAGSGNSHGFSDQSEFAKDAGTAYAPFDSRILVSGTANYDHFVSYQAAPTLSTSGTTTNLYGVYTLPSVTAGTVTNSYGAYVANPALSGSGAITNSWGIYVAAPSGATNNYAAALMGKVGIGTSTPAYALDVLGSNQRINMTDSGTGYVLFKQTNSGGSLYLAKEDSSGGAILTGSAAYSCVLAGDGARHLHLGTNGAVRMTIKSDGKINIASIPTSAAGLSAGDIWSDSGTLKIV